MIIIYSFIFQQKRKNISPDETAECSIYKSQNNAPRERYDIIPSTHDNFIIITSYSQQDKACRENAE